MKNREERVRVMFQAERMERATKAKGRPSGAIGQYGLAVLRCLLFRFWRDPEPSYKAIRRATGFSFTTISEALKRLEATGLLIIERRRRKTARGLRVDNNRYSFALPSDDAPKGLIPADVVRRKPESLVPYAEWEDCPLKRALDRLGDALSGQCASG